MIQAEVVRDKDTQIKKIFISGHSGYDELGKDIICSAVSTAMFVSAGLLEKIDCDYRLSSNEEKPTMTLEIFKSNDFVNLILENLVDTLQGITIEYSKYLKINEIRR